jgi:hypothetical protein
MTTTSYKNPTWWDVQHDAAWARVRDAFKRDWDQTRHDFGGGEPDTGQNIGNTLKQTAGKEAIPPRHQPTYEEMEPAYRYGLGARRQFGGEYPEWDDELEQRLQQEWAALEPTREEFWEDDREAIHDGWDYEE